MDVRPGYKQTEVGVIPEDWEVASVGDIASFTSGAGISVAMLHPESSDNPVPVYGGNGIAGHTMRPLIQHPTVVIGRVGQRCGEVYLTKGPTWITDNALYPRALHRRVHVPFLAPALIAAGLNDLKNRNDLPLITQSILHAVRIGIPSTKAEQEAIAEALSDADALIESCGLLLVKKRHLKQGAMQELLTGKKRLPGFSGEWEVKRLGEICEITMGRTPPRLNPEFWGHGYTWLSIADLRAKVVTDSKEEITALAAAEMRTIPKGTLLMSFKLSIGRLCFAGCDLYTNEAICSFNKLRANGDFLYYVLGRTDFTLYGNRQSRDTRSTVTPSGWLKSACHPMPNKPPSPPSSPTWTPKSSRLKPSSPKPVSSSRA